MNSLGKAHNKLKEYILAINCFDKSLQIDPKDIKALNNKGTALVDRREY